MCMGCPEGGTRDGVICRPMGLFSGQDADGVPDDCDNCTFTLTLIKTCPPVEGVCPGGVASSVTWSPTSDYSTDQKPCPLPSTGKHNSVISRAYKETPHYHCKNHLLRALDTTVNSTFPVNSTDHFGFCS